jgi:hypothetical protein
MNATTPRSDAAAAATRALEALREDDLDLVRVILESIVDEDRLQWLRCLLCGRRFEWPGLLDDHMWRQHPERRNGSL